MELPQSRPYGTQGRKTTQTFLSLYSPAQQDPCSTPSPPGGFLETHDFLQPLEGVGKKDGNKFVAASASATAVVSLSQSQSRSQWMTMAEGVVITAAQSSGSDKNDENSNCSSYTGSGFSLWEESDVNKGKTGKENIAGNKRVISAHHTLSTEGGMKTEGVPLMASVERPSQSLSSRPSSAQKKPGFDDMLKSAKSSHEDKDDEQEFVIKKEPSSLYKDTAQHEHKPNTPRSKHSATEQRRRSKINDRFSMLRELIPHGDQKRDKASFLLEVIEYVQFLQEKVHKYEDSCPNRYNQRPMEGLMDRPLVQTDGSKQVLFNKTSIYSPGCLTTSVNAPPPFTLAAESTNKTSQLWQTGSYTNRFAVAGDKLKDQEVTIESGKVSISTIYSQGLLTTLTQALQNSGVDLSQANISVQVDLGKRANLSTPILKKHDVSGIDDTLACSRREDKSDKVLKRFKTNKN
ncbi:hypothetical protein QVD17_15930 [Tagetes erecta]|uniref:BHLH domain-containing protein n=1 Tax=Tagetes erecta TaxID=13708 RepID=A0AAD8P032_TARER|nr:hypothetical protein QVD17_15930 [Tagetes erecta]